MGKVYVEITIENLKDRYLSEDGIISSDKIRAKKIKTLVDSGCTMLVLPQDLVENLGLKILKEKIIVIYANEQKDELPIASGLNVIVGDRNTIVDCIVGPPASEPLLGQIILERLALFVVY